jgi:hypothetical protein
MVPVLSLPINLIGIPSGIWILYLFLLGQNPLPLWVIILSIVNIIFYIGLMTAIYISTWRRTGVVLKKTSSRINYMITVNPVTLFVYWTFWTIPILGGLYLFITDQGKAWARTEKVDADRKLVEKQESS